MVPFLPPKRVSLVAFRASVLGELQVCQNERQSLSVVNVGGP